MAVGLAQCNRLLFSYPFCSHFFFERCNGVTSFECLYEPYFRRPPAITIVDHCEFPGPRAKQKEEEEDLEGSTGEKMQAGAVSRIRLVGLDTE